MGVGCAAILARPQAPRSLLAVSFVSWASCMFGSQPSVSATVLSSTVMLCASPPQPVGDYKLEMTNNNQDYTTNSLPFRYYSTFFVHSKLF